MRAGGPTSRGCLICTIAVLTDDERRKPIGNDQFQRNRDIAAHSSIVLRGPRNRADVTSEIHSPRG
jgi:hypothetical protein